jgi:hypothetical protein
MEIYKCSHKEEIMGEIMVEKKVDKEMMMEQMMIICSIDSINN